MPPRKSATGRGRPTEDQLEEAEPQAVARDEEDRPVFSLWKAYLFYFTGGFFGVHHWYLQRYCQMSVWMMSGGLFGLGLFLDFFYLPYYVRLANRDQQLVEVLELEYRHGSGRLSKFRGFACFGLMNYFYLIVNIGFTAELRAAYPLLAENFNYIAWGIAMALALIWLFEERETLKVGMLLENKFRIVIVAFLHTCDMYWQNTILFFIYCARTTRDPKEGWPKRRPFLLRIAILLSALFITNGLPTYWVLTRYEVDLEGKHQPLLGHIKDFLKTPQWKSFTEWIGKWSKECWAKGPYKCVDDFWMAVDVDGSSSACRTLGVEEDADWSTIKKAYRKLSKEYHPDRLANPTQEDRDKAAKINEAYQLLAKQRAGRGERTSSD
eukprot:Hpha_TRINITY_DN6535_c0_g1::TRINITY_DN6535_c0_g1_i1::g.45982::m.45982/K19370/DNAJC22; DnaJ homolog subfamily C member 22